MMNSRYSTTLASTTIMSFCLVALIPGSLRFASTWRDLYLYGMPDKGIENLLMPIGFYSLGFEIIGLIVLWTGFKKKERWAWFVMLILLFFFIFPPYVLTLFVKTYELKLGAADWAQLMQSARAGNGQSLGIVLGAVTFVVMLAALLLPARSFFGDATNVKTLAE